MKLFLHTPNKDKEIHEIYDRAFTTAIELYVVTAYLTDWDINLKLNDDCRHFRIIIGKDFGITKKDACKKVMKWLSAERKSQFLVADNISGFHPKAIFWKTNQDQYFSLIGSSNLTKAAFETNYEANIYMEISETDFRTAVEWIHEIETQSVVVSEDWLAKYSESIANNASTSKDAAIKNNSSVMTLKLPKPKGSQERVEKRRRQMGNHEAVRNNFHNLLNACKSGEISSEEFYAELPSVWSWKVGNRLQGTGWERRGKSANFKELATSFTRIYKADKMARDDVTVEELDRLDRLKNPARKAFLSEILCLTFPDMYPVLNKPVQLYLTDIKFKGPKRASYGAAYIDLAKKLRSSLLQNPNHPAKNLAELDAVIWLKYGSD